MQVNKVSLPVINKINKEFRQIGLNPINYIFKNHNETEIDHCKRSYNYTQIHTHMEKN